MLLKSFRSLDDLVSSLANKQKSMKSERLRSLLTMDIEGGLYPSQIREVVD